jgi:multimeric flavodoxin WrbA
VVKEKTKIVALVASPRKGRNSEYLARVALKAAEELRDVETELVTMYGKVIKPCTACYRCDMAQEAEEKICPAINDDFEPIVRKLIEADGIIISTPVYFGGVTAQLKAFIDRCESISGYGNRRWLRNPMRNKPAGAIAVGALPGGGMHWALDTINRYFMALQMIIASAVEGPAGSVGTIGSAWACLYPGNSLEPHAVERDELGLEGAKSIGRRVAILCQLLPRSAREAERESWLKWADAQMQSWNKKGFLAAKSKEMKRRK